MHVSLHFGRPIPPGPDAWGLDNGQNGFLSYRSVRDLYRILGVGRDADLDEIRRAYRELARRAQRSARDAEDDQAETPIDLLLVERVYATLADTNRRRAYDARVDRERPVRPRGDDALLADEIAIDFPSMAAVVPRVRASFFGPDGEETRATHTTEVELTPRQATEGTRVPLDLPVRHTCLICGGRGEVWTEACAMCAGTGGGVLSHHLKFHVPPGVRHGTRLHYSVTPPYAGETRVEIRIAIQ